MCGDLCLSSVLVVAHIDDLLLAVVKALEGILEGDVFKPDVVGRAPPPFSDVIYGNRQILPRPIAEPAAASIAANLPPKPPRFVVCSIVLTY